MGRQRWTSRLTVEDCPLYLCVTAFHRAGVFTDPVGSIRPLTWTDSNGFLLGRIEWRLFRNGSSGLSIYIRQQYARLNVLVDEQTIPFTTGGKRFWFLCGCGKRVERLYLSPGRRVFRCRHCYNLTYRSAQRHDQRVYDLARNPAEMQLALREHGGNWRRAFLGVRATELLVARYNRQSGRQ